MTNSDREKQNPSERFDSPADVVTAQGLTREQRIEILRQWEYDTMQLEVATEENMEASGDSSNRLQEIHQALQHLGEGGETNPAGAKLG